MALDVFRPPAEHWVDGREALAQGELAPLSTEESLAIRFVSAPRWSGPSRCF
jgi:hypothetical protein